MAKGQRTKAGHILQMIWHGADPNRFNPNGKRVVAHNAEDYDFIEGIEFDKLARKGAKALVANVPLEEMWTGKISGPLHYNLMDDQIFPFWIAKGVETPVVVDGVNCIDTEYVRPQLDRADRAFFSIEEGKAGGGADLGCYGMFTSFKWSSKRGNRGTSRFEVGFTTQAAVPRQSLTGGTKQNHKTRISAANVTSPLGLSIVAPGLAAKNVSLAIGDTAAQIVTKFGAQGLIVTAAGTIVAAAGERHTVVGTGDALTIYGDINVVFATETLNSLRDKIRAKAGRSTATVTGVLGRKVTVSGAGTAAINQDYYRNGVAPAEYGPQSGNPFYTPVGFVAGDYCIGRHTNGAWYILRLVGGVLEAIYSANANGQDYPPQTGWQVSGTGAAPAPTLSALVGAANIVVTYDAVAGNVGDIEAVPGAGYIGNSTQPDAASGAIDLEITNPGNALVIVTKTSGDAGYVLSTPQYGSDGGILTAMKPDDPIMPGHLFLYSADTPAGLDDEANLVGQIGEWDIDDPKICMPVSHHVRVNDPERPNLPATYNAHAEEES